MEASPVHRVMRRKQLPCRKRADSSKKKWPGKATIHPHLLKIDRPRFSCNKIRSAAVPRSKSSKIFSQQVTGKECVLWSFVGGLSNISRLNLGRNIWCRKSSVVPV